MTDRDLPTLLRELKAALEKHEPLDDDTRRLVSDVHLELDRALTSDDSTANEDLRSTLEKTVEHFEERHPTLVEATRRVLDQLSNLGI